MVRPTPTTNEANATRMTHSSSLLYSKQSFSRLTKGTKLLSKRVARVGNKKQTKPGGKVFARRSDGVPFPSFVRSTCGCENSSSTFHGLRCLVLRRSLVTPVNRSTAVVSTADQLRTAVGLRSTCNSNPYPRAIQSCGRGSLLGRAGTMRYFLSASFTPTRILLEYMRRTDTHADTARKTTGTSTRDSQTTI
jgi:hypothetical protein